jgi:glycosyltransferase involved in cell wall biosynthesis
VPAERVTIVPHGLLSDGGDAMTDLPPAEAAAEVTFLMFGKIKPYKGVDTLIAALARVPRDLDQAWRVQVVGQPYMDMAPLRDAAAGLGLAARVEFDLRPVPEAELATLFGRATAVVMPYREIDASGVLAMAIRAGRIVIASRIGNFAELLDDGRTALLVPPDDPAALGDAMARVLTEPALRARLAAGVRDLRDRMPTWFSIGAETAAIYRRLATARAVALETRGRAAASTR